MQDTIKEPKESLDNLFKNMKPDAEHYNQLLPYRIYDEETGVFHNRDNLGFARKLNILSGGNDEIAADLNSLIAKKLPTGKKWLYQFVLTGDHKVQQQLDFNRDIHSVRGGVYKKLAAISADFADMCATKGFPSNFGKHARFDLKDYNAYFFCTTSEKNKKKLLDVKEDTATDLTTSEIYFQEMDAQGLVNYVKDRLNNNPNQTNLLDSYYNKDDYISNQVSDISTRYMSHEKYIDITFQDETCKSFEDKVKTRVVCLTVSKLPSEMHLYQIPDLLASIKKMGTSLSCPFALSLQFQIEDSSDSSTQVQKKLGSLKKWQQSPMKVFMPLLDDEISDYEEIQRGVLNDQYSLCSVTIDLTLYSNENDYKSHISVAESLFKKTLHLRVCEMMQVQAFLSTLPFAGLCLLSDIKRAGRIHRIKSSNVASMLPIVAEWKGCYSGLLLPAARNQISYFDPFSFNTDNYNTVVAGASGAGKSVMVQSIILDVIARGGKGWVIDMGKSYHKLCDTVGGKYMDYQNIRLNPFSSLNKEEMLKRKGGAEDFANTINLIAGLFATMAYPRDSISDTIFSLLQEAVTQAYNTYGQQTKVDHVIDEIDKQYKISIENGDPDRRYKDLSTNLKKFKEDGVNSTIFNEASDLDGDNPFVVLEINGFPENILRAVMFALVIDINNRIYLSHDGRQKLFVIEEAWAQLGGDNQTIKEAIKKALRTFRKHQGALMVVTQNVQDYFENELTASIYSISDIKFIMRQGEAFGGFVEKHKDLFSTYEHETIKRFKTSKIAGFSSVLIQAGGYSSEHRFFLDPYTKMLTTTKDVEVKYINDLVESGLDIPTAVEKAAWHFFSDDMKLLNDFRTKKSALNNQ